MKRAEIPIYLAVHALYGRVSEPRSDYWQTSSGRLELARRMQDEMPLDSGFVELVQQVWIRYGKSTTSTDPDQKKVSLLCEHVERQGGVCFYADRGKGEWSDDLTLDRILAGAEYTFANTLAACSTHQSMRGNKSIESFLTEDSP